MQWACAGLAIVVRHGRPYSTRANVERDRPRIPALNVWPLQDRRTWHTRDIQRMSCQMIVLVQNHVVKSSLRVSS
jgi:hypothetical protein